MLFKRIGSNKNIEDEEFDKIYPKSIRKLADTHFTPIRISKIVANIFTSRSNRRILDIGAGAGKFCSIASVCSNGYFVGVEQRKGLCDIAQNIFNRYQLTNVEMIHANVLDISFVNYDAFYFFNSFQENINYQEKIDEEIELKRHLYKHYSTGVKEKLAEMPLGTTIVTYYSSLQEIPKNYLLKQSFVEEKLYVWEKSE